MRASEKKEIYIVEALRTIFGRPYKSLKTKTAVDLGVLVVDELMKSVQVEKKLVDRLIFGNVISTGLGQNLARQIAVKSGLPFETVSFTLNNVCGSGMQSVISAIHSLMLENDQFIIAGGAESVTFSPNFIYKYQDRFQEENFRDTLFHDGLKCEILGKNMGLIMERLIKQNSIEFSEQNDYVLESHRRASDAKKIRLEIGEVFPFETYEGKSFDVDDSIRSALDLESLKQLPPVFGEEGQITAATASSPCDGSAAVLLTTDQAAEKFGLKPLARIVGWASVSVHPKETFVAPLKAIQNCLKQTEMDLSEIDLIEISEAFASQMLILQKELKFPLDKINVWGGDLAIGHPLGVAGTRVLVTLTKALKQKQLKYGVCSVAYGGGGAVAMIVENCQI